MAWLFFSEKGQGKLKAVKGAMSTFFNDLASSKEAKKFLDARTEARELGDHFTNILPEGQEHRVLRDYVRRALAEALQPLTLEEIQRKVEHMGYKTNAPHAKTYLRKVLNRLPDVKRDEYGRWKIGASEAPT